MTKKPPAPWRNRITGSGVADPESLAANPLNWRIHPQNQQEALGDLVDRVGWVGGIIVNERTGYVVDGHLRVSLALKRGEKSIPVQFVDLSDEEERLVLATIDPLAAMAVADREKVEELLATVNPDSESLAALLASVREDYGHFGDGGGDGWGGGAGGEFHTLSFVVSGEQKELIDKALGQVDVEGAPSSSNKNGTKLAALALAYLSIAE